MYARFPSVATQLPRIWLKSVLPRNLKIRKDILFQRYKFFIYTQADKGSSLKTSNFDSSFRKMRTSEYMPLPFSLLTQATFQRTEIFTKYTGLVKKTDSFEMQYSRTAFLQFDRRYVEIPLVQGISNTALSIDLKHKSNPLWKLSL